MINQYWQNFTNFYIWWFSIRNYTLLFPGNITKSLYFWGIYTHVPRHPFPEHLLLLCSFHVMKVLLGNSKSVEHNFWQLFKNWLFDSSQIVWGVRTLINWESVSGICSVSLLYWSSRLTHQQQKHPFYWFSLLYLGAFDSNGGRGVTLHLVSPYGLRWYLGSHQGRVWKISPLFSLSFTWL